MQNKKCNVVCLAHKTNSKITFIYSETSRFYPLNVTNPPHLSIQIIISAKKVNDQHLVAVRFLMSQRTEKQFLIFFPFK